MCLKINITNNIFKRQLGNKAYELKDHLGNVRVTFSDIKMPTIQATPPYNRTAPFSVDLFSKSEYYPYGMKINELSYNQTGARYGYNGTHEQDKELNADGNYLDFGNFGYDTRVAMRRNQEPLRAKYPHLSGYSAYGSNPIKYSDLDGNEPVSSTAIYYGVSPKLKLTQWYSAGLGFYDPISFHKAAKYATEEFIPSAFQTVTQRSAYYGWVQSQVDNKGFKSKWFGAAQLVTGVFALGGTELPNLWVIKDNTEKFLKSCNKFLLEDNMKNAKDLLADGKLSRSFVDAKGKK